MKKKSKLRIIHARVLSVNLFVVLILFMIGQPLSSMANLSVPIDEQSQPANLSVPSSLGIKITGKVTDTNGNALSGVTVVEKGTTNGMITNADGKYVLSNVSDKGVLVFSFVGMKTVEISVAGKSVINTVLEEELIGIEEIVAVGYGVQKRSDITGAVASYSSKELEKMPQTNIGQALQGKIAGMAVTTSNSSAEDAGTDILIRGKNSISASSNPLIILDGIPYGQPLSEINPNDIESIEVLKDASSSAIYGARAANGVILLTTKKGVKGKTTIKLDSYLGFDIIAKESRYFTPEEFWEAFDQRIGQEKDFTLEEKKNHEEGKTTDWQKLAARNGMRQQYNLSISGANDAVKYYISGAWSGTKGITIGDSFARTTLRVNIEGKVNEWFSVGTNTQIAYLDRGGIPVEYHNTSTANAPSPYTLAYNEDGSLRIFPEPSDKGTKNILDATLWDNYNISRTVITNNYAIVNFPFIKGLSYKINTGYSMKNSLEETYKPSTSGNGYNDKGVGSVSSGNTEDWIVDNILNYDRTFGKHKIMLTGLYSAQEKRSIGHSKTGRTFPNDFQGVYGISSALTITSGENYTKSSFLSQMGRINYSYNGRYSLTATVRRDGFSGFGENNKTGIFPSAGIAWNFSEEGFMNRYNWLSRGKLRVSYGVNGNQAIGSYETIPPMGTIWYLDKDNISGVGYYPNNLGDPSLSWETTRSLNMGLDFGFLKGKLSGTIDVFKSKTNDLLLNRIISPINGDTRVKQNVGSTENFGYEVQITTVNINKNDFSWTTNFTLSYSKNKITDVGVYDVNGSPSSDIGNRWFIGKPLGVVYGKKFDHILQVGETAPVSQQYSEPGYALVHNLNDEGNSKDKIDEDDNTILGYKNPFYFAGLMNTITYKDFSLSFFLNGQFGAIDNGDGGYWNGQNTTYKEFWTPEKPDVVFVANNAFANPYGVNIWDKRNSTDFVRLQDITLSYRLPKHILDKSLISACEVYINAKNIYTFTNWAWGPDPSFSDQKAYPSLTTLMVGAKFTF